MKPKVSVNHWGTILSKSEIPLEGGSYYPKEDFNYIGEDMTIEKYRQKDFESLMQEVNEMQMNM